MDCRTCWKTVPRCTLVFVVVSAIASIAMVIACLATRGEFNCWLFNHLSMTPSLIFQRGEVWRLLSCYLVNPSFWAIIWFSLIIFFNGITFEAMKGAGWYTLLMAICLLINSLLSSAFMAFFGLIPGINSVEYFKNQWYDLTPIGSTPVAIMTIIFDIRVKKTKDVMCCCFRMPSWLYVIIMFIGCQLMMYPPWYGLFYNISALIIGYACPGKVLQPTRRYTEMQNAQANQAQAPLQVPYQVPQQKYEFTTINAPPALEKGEKKQIALKNGHAL